MFTSVDEIKLNNSNFAIVGASIKSSTEDPNDNPAENFILIYDLNLKVVYEDYFIGEKPVFFLYPKVCCLDNGNIIVVYKKKEIDTTLLWARCYTKELKLLWEREIFATDKSPYAYEVISNGSAGFVIGIVQQMEKLEFCFFNEEGMGAGYTEYKDMIGITGFNLVRVKNRTIAVFQSGTAGNIKECSIKAKVIALD